MTISDRRKHPVLCICGPTGAGKTAASLSFANECNGAIVNIDSRQIYKDFPLITAQPSPAERAAAPHYLYGFAETTEKFGAGQYARIAEQTIHTLLHEGKMPILVGGTGLYIKTLFNGLAPIPEIPEEVRAYWQQRYEEEGGPALFSFASEKDPQYTRKIHPNDRQRIIRVLEVTEATGKNISEWHDLQKKEAETIPFTPVFIGIRRTLAELTPLLHKRITLMLEAGAIDEAKNALTHCADQNAPGWTGIGCKELYAYLHERLTLQECLDEWFKNTRAYAKRQLTWFNAQQDHDGQAINWFTPEDIGAMLAFAKERLGLY